LRGLLLTLCCCLLLAGCGNTDEKKLMTFYATYDGEKEKKIEEMLDKQKDIEHANVILIDDKLLVAMQVKPWKKYKKKSIEKKVEDELKKDYPNLQLIVSADFKLHWESKKLIEKNETKNLSEKLEDLRKLAKEET
jgi:major membrane immunogen (membrane-anchored lipoprotein)